MPNFVRKIIQRRTYIAWLVRLIVLSNQNSLDILNAEVYMRSVGRCFICWGLLFSRPIPELDCFWSSICSMTALTGLQIQAT